MKLPSLSPWWLCLLALPIAAFLILGSPREDSTVAPSARIVEGEPTRQHALSTLPAYEAPMPETAPAASPMQQKSLEGEEEAGRPETPTPQTLALEIGPNQNVPAAFASFAKDFTPQDISVAQQLRQSFYDAVANLSPNDPDFAAKWNAAQQENDDLYRLYYGRDRYLTQHRKAYTESFADSGSRQPAH